MEKHVTKSKSKSPEAERKRTRGGELCLILWSRHLIKKKTQKYFQSITLRTSWYFLIVN